MNRNTLIALLNQDLSRTFQAVIAYVVYSQTFKGAQHASTTRELEAHARLGLRHGLTIARHIASLGGAPSTVQRSARMPATADAILSLDLNNQAETIINYHQRVAQCEAIGEYAMADEIREMLETSDPTLESSSVPCAEKNRRIGTTRLVWSA